jgi:hypothetical protein
MEQQDAARAAQNGLGWQTSNSLNVGGAMLGSLCQAPHGTMSYSGNALFAKS